MDFPPAPLSFLLLTSSRTIHHQNAKCVVAHEHTRKARYVHTTFLRGRGVKMRFLKAATLTLRNFSQRLTRSFARARTYGKYSVCARAFTRARLSHMCSHRERGVRLCCFDAGDVERDAP